MRLNLQPTLSSDPSVAPSSPLLLSFPHRKRCYLWASSLGPQLAQASCSSSSSSPWCSSSTGAAKAVSIGSSQPQHSPLCRAQQRLAICWPLQRPVKQHLAQLYLPVPGRKDVTLRKLDIKVETVNREPLTMHSDREDDTASVSTATRVMKAIYSVRVLLLPSLVLFSYS